VTRSRAVFAPVFAALALVAIGGGLAVYSGNVGLDFLPKLNINEPLLATIPPQLGASRRPLSRRVVLVIVDGLSQQHAYGLPLLDRLRGAGIDASATSHTPTISRPNYVTILTGVPPVLSGVRNNWYQGRVELDSIMDRLRARRSETAYVSDSSPGLAYMFSQDIEDSTYAPWPDGFVAASRLALRRNYPLVILLPGRVDYEGHLHGADSDEYRRAAELVDAQLTAALADIDLSRDTVIVTADHGHTPSGGHGGSEPEVLDVPLVMAGAGVRTAAVVRAPRLVDIAPTIAALLGAPAPGHGVGRTLVEALDLDADTAAAITAADHARIARNREVAAAEAQLARAETDATRARRVSLVVTAIALTVILLVVGTRLGLFSIDWRVLLIALPAFPLAFFALLEMVGQSFSLSSLPDEGVGARKVFHFGLASTVVHVIATWIALRGRVVLRDRLAAANAIAVCGMLVAGIPAALAWAVHGGGPFVELPGPKLLFLIPAMYIAVACYAIAAAVSLGLELVIFFARAVDPRLPLRRAERRVEKEKQRLDSHITTAPRPDTLD
jgi:hypothetical protein